MQRISEQRVCGGSYTAAKPWNCSTGRHRRAESVPKLTESAASRAFPACLAVPSPGGHRKHSDSRSQTSTYGAAFARLVAYRKRECNACAFVVGEELVRVEVLGDSNSETERVACAETRIAVSSNCGNIAQRRNFGAGDMHKLQQTSKQNGRLCSRKFGRQRETQEARPVCPHCTETFLNSLVTSASRPALTAGRCRQFTTACPACARRVVSAGAAIRIALRMRSLDPESPKTDGRINRNVATALAYIYSRRTGEVVQKPNKTYT